MSTKKSSAMATGTERGKRLVMNAKAAGYS
jgi:hypothetical protein